MKVLFESQVDNGVDKLLSIRQASLMDVTQYFLLLFLEHLALFYVVVKLTVSTCPVAKLAKLHVSFHHRYFLFLVE